MQQQSTFVPSSNTAAGQSAKVVIFRSRAQLAAEKQTPVATQAPVTEPLVSELTQHGRLHAWRD